MQDIKKIIGINLKYIRHQNGLSQEKFYEKYKLSAKYFSSVERGEINIGVELLQELARVIGKTKFDGYASSFDSDIKTALDNMTNESYDVVAEVNAGNTDVVEAESVNGEENSNTGIVLAFIFGVVVVLGIIMGYSVRKK